MRTIARGAMGVFMGLAIALAFTLSAKSPLGAQSTLGNNTGAGHPLVPQYAWPTGLMLRDDLLRADAQGAIAAVDRQALLTAIDHSLHYLATPAAIEAYRAYPVPGVTRDRVRRSLQRFRVLVLTSQSAQALHQAVQREFVPYQAAGNDGQGTVHFTGYFEPLYQASRTRQGAYQYPLYRRPPDLDQWSLPHPTRAELEGIDGLQGDRGPLQGLELVWLRDRLEAFLVQVQGSAKLQLTDGTIMSVGYAGRTDYDYTSLGRELINDGKIAAEDLTLDRLLAYFAEHPHALDRYIPRNQRFIFFRETAGGPPNGTLSVPVTAGRSIATDKSLMPPGALALIALDWPYPDPNTTWRTAPITRYVLDQDTGGAIRGAGRVDVFVGSGAAAGAQAGQVNTDGQLFYLLLRDTP